MKVVVALASRPKNLSGVPRHAINLVRCLLTRTEITAVHLVVAPWQVDFVQDASPISDIRLSIHTAAIGANTVSRNLWFYNQLPNLAAQVDADIVHLAYPMPVHSSAFRCSTVVTLHDLYPYDIPENFGFPKVLVSRAILRQCLRKIDSIVCVSQVTYSRLQSLDHGLARKATVISNCVEQQIDSEAAAPLECGGHPFLLCVAQHRRNKNILLALRAFEILSRAGQLSFGTRFLLVGIDGPETAAIREFIASSGLGRSVVLLNGISDAQLQWCYRNCRLLLAPSEFEGFGLPVAEAMLAGCRVVCSDIPAFRELGGGDCHYFSLVGQALDSLAAATLKALSRPRPTPISLPQLSPQVIGEQMMRHYRSPRPATERNADLSHSQYAHSTERQHPL